MRNRALIVGLLLLVSLAGIIGWQAAACYLANYELQSDMRDLAVQNPFRIGLASAPTEEGLREAVMASAKDHGILLDPRQVTVQCASTTDALSISLAADYEARVNLLVYSLPLHFTPSSSYSGKVVVR
jgi:hypothetical protein